MCYLNNNTKGLAPKKANPLYFIYKKLNELIKEGKIMEAFEKYYGEEVVIQVNGNLPITGKNQNRKRELIFLQEIKKLNSAEIKSITFGGPDNNVSMTEWAIDIENEKGIKKIIS